jgi:hypothetical protein
VIALDHELIATVRLYRDRFSGSYAVLVDNDVSTQAESGFATVDAAMDAAADAIRADLRARPTEPPTESGR